MALRVGRGHCPYAPSTRTNGAFKFVGMLNTKLKQKKQATPARKGVNPFTKEPRVVKAKLASKMCASWLSTSWIARKAEGIDINRAVQHMLNCANAGSCHGGGCGL